MIQDFLFPITVGEALDLLAQSNGKARIFAGGTALLLDGNKLSDNPDCFVSLSKVLELDGITEEGGFIYIGSNTTLGQCATNQLIKDHAPALAQACGNLGSTQIRNMATIAGNLVGAKPFADAAVVLTALGAKCVVKSRVADREVAIPDMYAGRGKSSVDSSTELITKIMFPARSAGQGSAYERLEIRNGLSFPLVNVAVRVKVDQGTVSDASIVVAPLNPGPVRVAAAEEFLVGKKPDEDLFEQAGRIASENVKFIRSPETCSALRDGTCKYDTCHYCLNPVRSSAEYRHRVLPFMVKRAMVKASGLAV